MNFFINLMTKKDDQIRESVFRLLHFKKCYSCLTFPVLLNLAKLVSRTQVYYLVCHDANVQLRHEH